MVSTRVLLKYSKRVDETRREITLSCLMKTLLEQKIRQCHLDETSFCNLALSTWPLPNIYNKIQDKPSHIWLLIPGTCIRHIFVSLLWIPVSENAGTDYYFRPFYFPSVCTALSVVLFILYICLFFRSQARDYFIITQMWTNELEHTERDTYLWIILNNVRTATLFALTKYFFAICE